MPDGKRKRRHCNNPCRRHWYARHRAIRFSRRFGLGELAMQTAEPAERVGQVA